MSLYLKAGETGAGEDRHQQVGLGGSIQTHNIYGQKCGLMIATRGPGYHSAPHQHLAEQLNYVSNGAMWLFIDEDAYELKEGDFLRVPAMTPHWAWNRSNEPCTLAEAFSAPHWITRAGSVGLLAEGEAVGEEQSMNLPVDPALARRVEEKHFGTAD